MTAASRTRTGSPSHRFAACANQACSRPFAVCGRCDRGRRFCSPGCADNARRSSLQRAGQRYQATARGRQLHATRQARYRDRLRAVTYQSSESQHNRHGAREESDQKPAKASVYLERRQPPDCASCGRHGTLLRSRFLHIAPRRAPKRHRHLRSAPEGIRAEQRALPMSAENPRLAAIFPRRISAGSRSRQHSGRSAPPAL